MRGLLVAALLAQVAVAKDKPECDHETSYGMAVNEEQYRCVAGKWVRDLEAEQEMREAQARMIAKVRSLGTTLLAPEEIAAMSWQWLVPNMTPFYEEDVKREFNTLMAQQMAMQRQAAELHPAPPVTSVFISPVCEKARAEAIERVREAWAPRSGGSITGGWTIPLWAGISPCYSECLSITTTNTQWWAPSDPTSAACYRCMADAKDARDKAAKERADREEKARAALDAVDAACGEPKP